MKTLSQILREQDARKFHSQFLTVLEALRFEKQWLAQQKSQSARG